MKDDLPPEERARIRVAVKGIFDRYMIKVQARQQADEINRAKKRTDGMKAHDAFFGLADEDEVDHARRLGYTILRNEHAQQ